VNEPPPAGSDEVQPQERSGLRTVRTQPLMALCMNRPVITHVQSVARALTDGDFDTLIIWGELAAHNIGPRLGGIPAPTAADVDALLAAPDHLQPASLRDLAQCTGIPRETVRRKLERLAHRGHVRRMGTAWVVCMGVP
jgi:predicted Rossmann fold nucleotide-binding protein DprA/Smf involved in DNA uptake